MSSLSWPEFCRESLEFLEISEKLNDTWEWIEKNSNEGQSYLKFKQKINHVDLADIIEIEYNVVYSISYQVPILYFQAYQSDGKLMSLEEVWKIFKTVNNDQEFTREEMLGILTQMEHPVLFKPYLCLHPCKTLDILESTPQSKNRVLTFISVMGPYLKLDLCNEYGLFEKEETM